jgi:hypothetical protein
LECNIEEGIIIKNKNVFSDNFDFTTAIASQFPIAFVLLENE